MRITTRWGGLRLRIRGRESKFMTTKGCQHGMQEEQGREGEVTITVDPNKVCNIKCIPARNDRGLGYLKQGETTYASR